MFPGASRSDLLIAIGAPVIGLLALVAGISTSDVTTAFIGAAAILCGLLFAIPLSRRGRDGGDGDGG